MSTRANDNQGLRGIALIAITYVYFLIFAQFGFLARLAEQGIGGNGLRAVMGAMAMGGILFSLLAPGLAAFFDEGERLRIGLAICGVAAGLSLAPLNTYTASGIAFLIGVGLGIVTVTLVSDLRAWIGANHPLVKVGVGTGLGYFICNLPFLFAGSPKLQALTATGVCCIGILIAGRMTQRPEIDGAIPTRRHSFRYALIAFTALVWLDSAAFYIIQHTPALKAGTWLGSAHLWTNGCVHFAAAVIAGLLLARRDFSTVLAAAVVALGVACVWLAHGQAMSASLLYPVGVSLYSVTLVAYPSFLTSAVSYSQRARQAGSLYAVAGWIASALGIGMGQNLGYVPFLFVLCAAGIVLLPLAAEKWKWRKREVLLLGGSLASALLLSKLIAKPVSVSPTAAERGRQVYIAEGCIDCHSQYVRPHSPDELMWGPTESLSALHDQRPPLIGNRRQGPDLTQVGARRSPLWLKAHLENPADVSGGSVMPSYAFLFEDRRGDDLVAYLSSLRNGDAAVHRAEELAWTPDKAVLANASTVSGEQVYQKFCATCHDANGAVRTRWAKQFREAPLDLLHEPFKYVRPSGQNERVLEIARMTKFGIPETDMPGHEYLSDQQIASVSAWIDQSRLKSQ